MEDITHCPSHDGQGSRGDTLCGRALKACSDDCTTQTQRAFESLAIMEENKVLEPDIVLCWECKSML